MRLWRPSGKLLQFRRSGGQWISQKAVDARLLDRRDAAGNHIGWEFHDKSARAIELFDGRGNIVSVEFSNGARWTWIRSGEDYVVEDNQGRALSVDMANGRIVSVSASDGQSVTFGYDDIGNLVSATYTDGSMRRYHYNESGATAGVSRPHHLTGVTDESGKRLSYFHYDANGKAILTERNGGAGRFQFSYQSGTTSIFDPLGAQSSTSIIKPHGVSLPTGSTQPAGAGCGPASKSTSYDEHGHPTARTDFNGNRVCLKHSTDRGLELIRVEGLGAGSDCPGDLAAYSPVVGQRKITTAWHPTERLPVQRAEPGRLSTWVYHGQPDPTANGAIASCAPAAAVRGGEPLPLLCKHVESATSDERGGQGLAATPTGTPRVTTWTYNADGKPLTLDGPRTDVADLTRYAYYASDAADCGSGTCTYRRGDLHTVSDALGHVTTFLAYDGAGRAKQVRDSNGTVTTLGYDIRGRLVSRSLRAADGTTETMRIDYLATGLVDKITQPDGVFTRFHYDAAQRLIAIEDALGNRIEYTLDAAGNRTREQVKDPNGQLKRGLSRVYDALGRLQQLKDASGATLADYRYDANGNLDESTDGLGRIADARHDPLDRLIQQINNKTGPGSDRAQVDYGYDAADRLRRVVDPRGLATEYTYDGLGNLTKLTSPDTGVTTFEHDAAGHVVQRTDARGNVLVQ
ncbi:MAG TPA: hypothetical protein VEA16_06885, partial [Vicinamibacterales bacterium]|nr:hypothetical protein [Vicinamibacterales bacterium]